MSAVDSEGNVIDIPFQVTDTITRNLLSVSKLCEQGAAVYFGPGPKFPSITTTGLTPIVALSSEVAETTSASAP